MLNNDVRASHDDLHEPVRSLLAAAAAPTESGPLPGEAEAVAAFRASQTDPRRSPLLMHIASFKTAIAAALGTGVLLTAGVGAAAAGSLPGAAQDTASELLSKVGVTVPGADDHADGNADERGTSDEAGKPSTDKGSPISGIATTTTEKGVDKGALISTTASGGKSRAGQHGKAAEDHGKAGENTKGEDSSSAARDGATHESSETGGKAPVTTPNDGGTDTADTASAKQGDTASTHGTTKAGSMSSDRATEGSANRP